MDICTQPELGRLLALYEAGTLDSTQALRFEEHLLVCEYCRLEVEGAMDVGQKLSRHRDAIRAHYSETGAGFAAELANLAKDQRSDPVRGKRARTLTSIIAWMNASTTRRIAYPSAVIALVALFVVLKTYPPASRSSRGVDTVQGYAEGPAESPTFDGSNSTTLQAETAPDEKKSPIAGEDGGSPRSEHLRRIDRLLPIRAIPYVAISTRSSEARDSVFAAEFQRCMAPYDSGDFARSAARLRELIAFHPSSEQAHLYLGSALYMTGDFAGSIAALSAAERIGGERVDPKTRLYHAASLIKLQRFSEARPLLERLGSVPDRSVAEQSRNLLSELKAIK
jgi:hypothetical protein